MKTYSVDVAKAVEKALDEAPQMEPKYYTHDELLLKIKDKVRELYLEKNYEPRDIVAVLRQAGLQIIQREIREMLQDVLRRRRRKARNIIAKI